MIRTIFQSVLATSVLSSPFVLADADPPDEPTFLDTVMAMKGIRSAEISPDGKHVAYTVFENDFEADKDMRQLWIVPTAGGDAVQLTHGDEPVGEFEWSSDSAWIAFLRDDQLLALRRSGGEPKTLDVDVEIPFDCDSFARQSLYALTDNIAELQEDHNEDLAIEGIVINQFNSQARLPGELVEQLKDEGYAVLDTYLGSSVK